MYKNIKIDKSLYEPIYQQLTKAFRELIITGELSAGDKIMPEPELAALLGVNRMTLRKSLKLLAAQGLIVLGGFLHIVPGRESWRRVYVFLRIFQLSEWIVMKMQILIFQLLMSI